MLQSRTTKHALHIVERPLARNKLDIPMVSLSAFAYLFSELIGYAVERSGSITELEDRLERVGFDVGIRILELLTYRERTMRRSVEVLDILKYIHSVAWPYMFGKKADDLQQANAADDEYMISDNDLLVGKFISIPKRDYSSFVPGSLVAGIVRGMLDAAGFPARVSAHFVEQPSKESSKPTTTILIKFDATVMQRQAAMDAAKRGM